MTVDPNTTVFVWIIGALAFVTIGLVMLLAIYHFGTFLKDPRSRGAAANVVSGGTAASTKVAEEAPDGSYHDRPLKAQLDRSEASAHPDDLSGTLPGSHPISH